MRITITIDTPASNSTAPRVTVDREPAPADVDPSICLNCGNAYSPVSPHQKFCTTRCGNQYRRGQPNAKPDAASVKTLVEEEFETTPKRESRIHPSLIPKPLLSSDPFYEAQLKKAARTDPATYGKYF